MSRTRSTAQPFGKLRAVSEAPHHMVQGEVEPRAVSDGAMLELALHGGEDYELLFTVPPRKASRIPAQFRGIPLHCIGEIRSSKDRVLVETSGKVRPLKPCGYDHFRNR